MTWNNACKLDRIEDHINILESYQDKAPGLDETWFDEFPDHILPPGELAVRPS
jgi:hypothetical protein